MREAGRRVSEEQVRHGHGLDAELRAQVEALAAQVVAHDGGRLKLELDFVADNPIDLSLAYDGSALVGFAGLYSFGSPQAEVAGMVAPDRRRQGLGRALLATLEARADRPLLLVTPQGTPAGRAFAQARGGTLDHSEHFLVLRATPEGPQQDPGISLRRAVPADEDAIRTILGLAFGWEPPGPLVDKGGDTTYVIEEVGLGVIGTVRLAARGGVGGVYGFAVHPDRQGHGIGRDVLARCCRLLRESCPRVTLEVETQNANALRLYTSTGFALEAGEDYWLLPA
jgi:ribosomal protein S18 acetylase RimI-like enzyme